MTVTRISAEVVATDVMDAILNYGLSEMATSIVWFNDTSIRLDFGDYGSFIVSVEVE
jgi:hypothetical protein